ALRTSDGTTLHGAGARTRTASPRSAARKARRPKGAQPPRSASIPACRPVARCCVAPVWPRPSAAACAERAPAAGSSPDLAPRGHSRPERFTRAKRKHGARRYRDRLAGLRIASAARGLAIDDEAAEPGDFYPFAAHQTVADNRQHRFHCGTHFGLRTLLEPLANPRHQIGFCHRRPLTANPSAAATSAGSRPASGPPGPPTRYVCGSLLRRSGFGPRCGTDTLRRRSSSRPPDYRLRKRRITQHFRASAHSRSRTPSAPRQPPASCSPRARHRAGRPENAAAAQSYDIAWKNVRQVKLRRVQKGYKEQISPAAALPPDEAHP